MISKSPGKEIVSGPGPALWTLGVSTFRVDLRGPAISQFCSLFDFLGTGFRNLFALRNNLTVIGEKKPRLTPTILIAALLMTSVIPTFAKTKPGDTCKKAQQLRVVGSVSLKCVKVGKKFVWREVRSTPVAIPAVDVTPTPSPSPSASSSSTPSPSPSPSPTPEKTTDPAIYIVPTSFQDLYEKRKGVSYAAWKSVSTTIEATADRGVKLEILIGPNTKPHFNGYEEVVNLLARAFPKASLPPRTLVIQFNSSDIDWAEAQYQQKVPEADRSRIDFNERDGFIRGNCPMPNNCNGARQQTTISGWSIIPHGVASVSASAASLDRRISTGMLEIHEYFHGMQRVPLINKDLSPGGYPPAWVGEGSADFIQNAVVNRGDFESYRKMARDNCDISCVVLSEERIELFLTEAKDWNVPEGFNRWTNYSLGSVVMEVLAAVGGHESILALYEALGSKLPFAQAFEKVYRTPWQEAIPIIAKTIYANTNNL